MPGERLLCLALDAVSAPDGVAGTSSKSSSQPGRRTLMAQDFDGADSEQGSRDRRGRVGQYRRGVGPGRGDPVGQDGGAHGGSDVVDRVAEHRGLRRGGAEALER